MPQPVSHPTPISIAAALRRGQHELEPTSPSPRLDAEALLAHVSGLDRARLIADADRPLSDEQRREFEALLERRRRGEPIAYLTGAREFWSLTLGIAPSVLIPRPETELLVELALAKIPRDSVVSIADLGTGSGAIALAIAAERPRGRVVATDRSTEALEIARQNAARLKLNRIEFRAGDWLEPLADESFDVIVSNPPYVRADDPHLLQGDVRFEPRAALVAGGDGLDALRRIVHAARRHLRPGGWLLLEHGWDQATAVARLLHESGYRAIVSHPDLAGHLRVTECRR